jgi:hypothetical protein
VLVAASTATWLAAIAGVLAAITTTVLAIVAVLQIRSSDRQLDVMREHVNATDRLAQAAEKQTHQQRMKDLGVGGGSIFSPPEKRMADALAGIDITLARAFPETDELQDEVETDDVP